mgnify:CR=1 FL=1
MYSYYISNFIIELYGNKWMILDKDKNSLLTRYNFCSPEDAYYVLLISGIVDENEEIKKVKL